MEFPFFEFIFAFVIIVYLLETYVDFRQWRAYKTRKVVPKELSEVIKQEEFEKAQAYGSEKLTFGMLQSAIGIVEEIAILWYGGLPWLWNISLQVLYSIGLDGTYEITQAIVFIIIYTLYGLITKTPFSLYSIFVIEEKYGFNKQTLWLYFVDQLKSIGLMIVIGIPIMAAALSIVEWGGVYFWLYLWGFMFVVQMIAMIVYPFIAQLFNKFTPLEEGDLRQKIVDLAQRVEFPLTQLFVVDGSKRSSHSNAYFFGLFKNKRIVIFDTLINQVDHDGIVAIVGHELGHWKLNHTLQNLVIANVQSLIFLYLFGQMLNNKQLYRAFGFSTQPKFIGMMLFSMLYGPVDHVIGVGMNFLSRKFEYEADGFAVTLGYDLTNPLITIHKENLGNLSPDALYSAYHFSHPTLVERISNIKSLISAKEKKKE